MSVCVICEKPISEGATHCSVACLDKSRSQGFGERTQARTKFSEAMTNMLKMEVEPAKPSEPTMITVKHRWKRNKLETCGNVVLSFNDVGIAKVPNIGNNILDVELYIQSSRNLARIISVGDTILETETEPVVEKKPVVIESQESKPVADITSKVVYKEEVSTEKVEVKSVETPVIEESVEEEVVSEEPKEEVITRKPVRPPKKR
jgi:hypothetical protein